MDEGFELKYTVVFGVVVRSTSMHSIWTMTTVVALPKTEDNVQ